MLVIGEDRPSPLTSIVLFENSQMAWVWFVNVEGKLHQHGHRTVDLKIAAMVFPIRPGFGEMPSLLEQVLAGY
jgi:hypothetical protein